jgi:hypothetical protein
LINDLLSPGVLTKNHGLGYASQGQYSSLSTLNERERKYLLINALNKMKEPNRRQPIEKL